VAEPRYIYEFDYSGADLIYIGKATIGTAVGAFGWQLMKLTYTAGNATSILFADGNSAYDNVWTDRATYAYS